VHFSKRFNAVSEELAVYIFRVGGRFSILKTKEITGATSQKLISFLFTAFRI
jgi:hypothetical protein